MLPIANHELASPGWPLPAKRINSAAMDISGADDETLMQAYGAGDLSAFEALYARHRAALYRYLLRSTRNPHLADDLFQETWSRVVDARARWQPRAKFLTWLLHIAHHLAIDAYRRQPAQASPEETETVLSTLATAEHEQPEYQLSDFQTRRRLQLAIERLPDEQRHAILLRLEHDLSLDEIADVTGTPRETVKSRIRYATQRIREELDS